MKSKVRQICGMLRWLTLSALCGDGAAATISLGAVADTSLYEARPDYDLGGTTLVAGTNYQYSRARALFRFDLSGIPAGAVVSEARVSLYVSRTPDSDQRGGPVNTDFSLHRLLASWGQGSGSSATGSIALPGDATWNERHFGSLPWATPGGLIGEDYAMTASATTLIGGVGGYVWGSSGGLVDDVRFWLEEPELNFGLILVNQGEALLGGARRFGAREQPGGLVPAAQLIVTYSVVPEPSVAGLWLIGVAGAVFLRARRV